MIGFDYQARTPWEAREEFCAFFDSVAGAYRPVAVIANSIGAYFAMEALSAKQIEKAFFISPIVNLEQLIGDMMRWAGVSEEELRAKREIETAFGETLSWEYLCYVRDHPPRWHAPTHILYGGKDHLTAAETMTDFAGRVGASLTVMENGEHWFHTEEQLAFLDRWIVSMDARSSEED